MPLFHPQRNIRVHDGQCQMFSKGSKAGVGHADHTPLRGKAAALYAFNGFGPVRRRWGSSSASPDPHTIMFRQLAFPHVFPVIGWATCALLTLLLFGRLWDSCGFSVLGTRIVDRCNDVSRSTPSIETDQAITPILRARYHQSRLDLSQIDQSCRFDIDRAPDSLAAMAGCWIYEGVEAGARSTAVDWQICLDDTGTGRQSVGLPGGSVCEGPVAAEFGATGIATIRSVGTTPCTLGPDLFEIVQRCRWSEGAVATCVGAQPAQSVEGVPGRLTPLSLNTVSVGGGP